MKKQIVTFLLISFSFIGFSQNFSLIEPNILKLKEENSKGKNTEPILNYLKNNYNTNSEKLERQFLEWETTKECAFKQKFKNNIIYSVFNCKEALGMTIELEMPKIKRKELMLWIEKIYEVDKIDDEENIWKENNSKFEPKEAIPGCYYKIKERNKTTFVSLYCGC